MSRRRARTRSRPHDAAVEVEQLVKRFPLTRGVLLRRRLGEVPAVDDVTLEVRAGESLGIVGETGSGKSTLARILLNLLEPTSGVVRWRGEDVTHARGAQLAALRRARQLVFQDPSGSLNPRRTVGATIAEPFAIHGLLPERAARARRVRGAAGAGRPRAALANRYPHELSGGHAPARRDRARDRAEPGAARRRRAGLGARRLDPGADPHAAARAAARAGTDARADRARPRRRAPHVRPRRGDARRASSSRSRRWRSCTARRARRTRASCSRRCRGSRARAQPVQQPLSPRLRRPRRRATRARAPGRAAENSFTSRKSPR